MYTHGRAYAFPNVEKGARAMTEQNGTKAPADKICAYEYTVKRGDSFYLIAHRLGGSLAGSAGGERSGQPRPANGGGCAVHPLGGG